MTRTALPPSVKGSQFWLQTLVNQYPDQINKTIAEKLGERDIEWLSPVAGDGYAEYRDQSFLDRLGVRLDAVPLAEFWPKGGPRWDGLARTRKGTILLVEAKSRLTEMISKPRAMSADSRERIRASLSIAKHGMGASPDGHWAAAYYQYTNRLAHFYLLRKLNGVPAHLIFLYFINDTTVHGPTSATEWQRAFDKVNKALGMDTYPLSPYIHDVFFDVSTITG